VRDKKYQPVRSNWSPAVFGAVRHSGGVKGRSQLPGYVDRYLDGQIKIDEMITEVLPLDEINDAFELMHAGKVIRSVIKY